MIFFENKNKLNGNRKSSQPGITVAHLNIQSLNDRKQALLEAWLHSEDGRYVKVLCLTEHHRVKDDLERISFGGFRLASSFCRESRNSRGGVCIFVHNSLQFDELPLIKQLSISNILEVCGINIFGSYIVCAYRPKTINNDNFIDNLENILNHLNNKMERNFLLCGDFNVNLLVNGRETSELLCLLNSFGAKPFVQEPTRITEHSSTCIDNIISNTNLRNVNVIDLGLSDHCLQYATWDIVLIKSQTDGVLKHVRDVNKSNREELKYFFSSVNWDPVCTNFDMNQSFNIFHDVLLSAFDRFCPLKKVQVNKKCSKPKWITPGIMKSCETKRDLFIELKHSKEKSLRSQHYKKYCSILHKVVAYAKKKNNECIITNSKNKIKTIWSIVNETVKGQTSKQIESFVGLTDGVKIVENELEAPNLFNSYFTTNSSNRGENEFNNIKLPSFHENSMFITPISRQELLKLVSNLNNKRSCGYDGLPITIIKDVIDVIADALVHLVNLSIATGKFPERLKKAHIKPLHKSDSRMDVHNYRPIALLPVLSKIFEKFYSIRLSNFLFKFNIVSKSQFGFQPGKCTVDAVFDMMDFVADSLNSKSNVVTVLLDMSKAFDYVDHQVLAAILIRYGIRGNCLNWLKSYLTNRKQSVILPLVDSRTKTLSITESRSTETRKGVPQGSVLGPLLFLLYVNHLPELVNKKLTMFADDISVFFKFERRNVTQLSDEISDTIYTLVEWLRSVGLKTNASKTKMIHFRNYNTSRLELDLTMDNTKISLVDHARFLGIYADEHMNWKKHIEVLAGKLSSFSYALRCLSKITTTHASLQAYYAYFHSRLLYGLALWGGSVELDKIFILQKRCVRILSGVKSNRVSCRDLFWKLKIHTVTALYIIELCKLVRHLPEKFPISAERKCGRLKERFRHHLEVKFCRTTSHSKSTSHAAVSVYNKLPKNIKLLPGDRFLKVLKEYLLVMCPYNLNEYYENCK